MNKIILIDTGIIAAFFNLKDKNHERAVSVLDKLRRGEYGTCIISDYILDETVTLLYVRTKRADLSIRAGELILNNKIGLFYPISNDIIKNSSQIYQKYISQDLSFTDCTLIALGQKLDCNLLLTFSKEFNGIMAVVDS